MADNSNSSGAHYVVANALYSCNYGSAPVQLQVMQNKTLYVQNQLVGTDKEVKFVPPTFGTCSMSLEQGKPCKYAANGQWNASTVYASNGTNVLTENSEMICPLFNGTIKNIFHGQVASVSAQNLEEFEMESAPSMFTPNSPADDKKDSKEENKVKCFPVNGIKCDDENVASNKINYVRINKTYTFEAKDVNEEQKKYVSWVVGERVVGNKRGESNYKCFFYDCIGSPFQLHFPFQNKEYFVEGVGYEGKYYKALKSQSPTNVNDINAAITVKSVKNSFASVFVKKGDRTLRETNNKGVTSVYYVRQGDKVVVNLTTKLELDSNFEIVHCVVTQNDNQSVREGMYNYEDGSLSLEITPENAEVDYTIKFQMLEMIKGEEGDVISERTIVLHSYDDVIMECSVDSWFDEKRKDRITKMRPGNSLAFKVKKNNSSEKDNEELEKIDWVIKYNGKVDKTQDDVSEFHYYFKKAGNYDIEAKLQDTSFSDGGVCYFDDNGSKKTLQKATVQNKTIKHVITVSENLITGFRIGRSLNTLRYENIEYPVKLDFDFGDATTEEERNKVKFEPKDLIDSKRMTFKASKPDRYEVTAELNGKTQKLSFDVFPSGVEEWRFIDSKGQSIQEYEGKPYVGKKQQFGVHIFVPSWSVQEKQKSNPRVVTVSFVSGKTIIKSFPNVSLSDVGEIKLTGVDVQKDILLPLKASSSSSDVKVKCVIFNAPQNNVKDLTLFENGREHGVTYESKVLVVTTKPIITGEFVDDDGSKLIRIKNYGETVKVRLRMLNLDDEKKYNFLLYERVQWGWDSVKYKQVGLTPDIDGLVEIDIKTGEGELSEDKHGSEKGSPRLFYFWIRSSDQYVLTKYEYPKSLGVSSIDIEAKDETMKENGKVKSGVRSYFEQLKLLPKNEENDKYCKAFLSKAVSLVGEQSDGDKDFCAGKNCITRKNYKIKKADNLIYEVGMKLSGFGGYIPTTDFTKNTYRAICQFQRDYMKVAETGRICGSLLKAIDEFCDRYEPFSEADFTGGEGAKNKLRCPCKKCLGFGSGKNPGKKPSLVPQISEAHRDYEYPGIHRSLLYVVKAVMFYLEQTPLEDGSYYKFNHVESGYRCDNDNIKKSRKSSNHKGKSLDLHFDYCNSKHEIIRCNTISSKKVNYKDMNWIRENVFKAKMNAVYAWMSKNHISLEMYRVENPTPGYNAGTWVHFDVREFSGHFLADEYFVNSFQSYKGMKLVDLAKSIGKEDLCKCTSLRQCDIQRVVVQSLQDETEVRKDINTLSTSQKGIDFIKSWETLHLEAYLCPEKYPSVGYGYKIPNATKDDLEHIPDEFKVITEEKAEELLKECVKVAENGVKKSIKVPLYQYEFDALVSLCYNAGANFLDTGGANGKDTKIKKHINKSDYAEGCKEMADVTNKGLPGLVKRREAEMNMFNDGDYEDRY